MTTAEQLRAPDIAALQIRVQGLVQGVGFRPMVWREAHRLQIRGHIRNDGAGVLIVAVGTSSQLDAFIDHIKTHPPMLARVDEVQWEPLPLERIPPNFTILDSTAGDVETGIVPDAASCPDCLREIFDPFARRYRYPFTNCTHCGPRLTIQQEIPYDRSGTTMADFSMCADCEAEYRDPVDRRFHAQPIACHACGPKAWLERADGKPIAFDVFSMLDAVDAACTLLQRGHILAIKGLGGFQLACDATQEGAVARLRRLKAREGKPFALMARDLTVARRYCQITETEEALLQSPAAPIVLLQTQAGATVAPSVAPGMRTLGLMLPNTPLHHLMLRRMDRPIVLTSGNRADEPQWTDNESAKAGLGHIAEYFLLHDRAIAQRVDDSIVAMSNNLPRIVRRSRGYAPTPILLPDGFGQAPAVLAMGSELKNTFCLLRRGRAILSHHIGDLDDALTHADYRRAIAHYAGLFAHAPDLIAVDRHPEYRSSKAGYALAAKQSLPVRAIQHHHAHIAACLIDNGISLDHPPVLGIALDGLGYGDDGQLWGGEFLLADYRTATRMGTFKPVPLLGGEQAMREPWRNTYAHLMAELGWARFAMNYVELDLYAFLDAKPRRTLDNMITHSLNSPPASSCGRLFDAVAAAIGLCRDRASYEGQAAIELEHLVDRETLEQEDDSLAYPFTIPLHKGAGIPYIEPLAMWQALLGDLQLQTPPPVIAARFHKGLAMAICAMAGKIAKSCEGERTIRHAVLSGGVFQNRVLAELVARRLERLGFAVLSHHHVPANDGGLSLGQAAVAAAQALSHME
ncbi:MAG: Carbamoyltransferase HypF [Nitrospira sp.]|nr:MAG: Carbamoyltransferase HypF [Nitrospira sp.]